MYKLQITWIILQNMWTTRRSCSSINSRVAIRMVSLAFPRRVEISEKLRASRSLGKFIASRPIDGMQGCRWHTDRCDRMFRPRNVQASVLGNRESQDINFVVDVSYQGTLVFPSLSAVSYVLRPTVRICTYTYAMSFPYLEWIDDGAMCRLTVYHSNGFPPCTPRCFVGETRGHGTRVTSPRTCVGANSLYSR